MKMSKLFRPRIWSSLDIILLKWSVLLFGAIVGAFSPKCIKRNMWALSIAAVLLAIKPTIAWLNNKAEG